MKPECFGFEFFDEQGTECPFGECLVRVECKNVQITALGLQIEKRKKQDQKAKSDERFKKALKKQNDKFFQEVIDKGTQYPKQKKGYKKPGKLIYRDEGYPKDAFLSEITDCFRENGCESKATKYLHSFFLDEKFVVKVDLRRKNSVLVYVREELANLLTENGMTCRGLYDSEIPNFPDYLCWATLLSSSKSVERFLVSVKEIYGFK